MSIRNQEALDERANNLGSLNGIRLVLVSLKPAVNPTEAELAVHFHNTNELTNIEAAITADPSLARSIFPITGGHRVPGGPLDDQVHVIAAQIDSDENTVLNLRIRPIGDYSTYTLSVVFQNIDPIFGEIGFKFRPGCFNNCPPEWDPAPAPGEQPIIDYLAKDYETFRHTLIAWMMQKVPGWVATSEADLDQTLIELFSVAGDELSDFQDRVMNEAYLGMSRKRVSLARHARLMDYHIHQGNQASTWLTLEVNTGFTLASLFQAATGKLDNPESAVFVSTEDVALHPLLNNMQLYTWSGGIPALAAGATEADLLLTDTSQAAAEQIRDMIRTGDVGHLVIQEHLNPLTGEQRGFDPTKRQLLTLVPEATLALEDPLTGTWYIHIQWETQDRLEQNYCFEVDCPNGLIDGVSLFHGNLIQVHHGRPVTTQFLDATSPLTGPGAYHYTRDEKTGIVTCILPEGPLAYLESPAGGEEPPESTLVVQVVEGGVIDAWDEVINLVHSDDSDEGGDHFVVETDELGRSLIRFGNGINGKILPHQAVVQCWYQVGAGPDGNVGAHVLTTFDGATYPEVEACWNPFDVTGGQAPEPTGEIIRRVPEAYRFRQLRAITLQDYVDRAEELPEVSRASARYMWTGSWRTVRVAIDPAGTTDLTPALTETVARHLEAVRLIGEDLEIRPPRFVPLDIELRLCIHADYWPEDVRFFLEQAFSEGYLPDGSLAFFHPDRWTFGQPLYASALIGQAQAVEGVDHVIEVSMQRWNESTPGTWDIIEVLPNEIIRVRNNPDNMEEGFMKLDLQGGRR